MLGRIKNFVRKVVEDMAGIDNNRLFIVDNSLAQNKEWEKELFRAIAPLKKKWISFLMQLKKSLIKCFLKTKIIQGTSQSFPALQFL